ncbi:CYTOCHROME P450 98A9 [Salix koriyanagi]|uniref:CYTOCHROME P450 98A9 n=1 Tax=Salix koriyanagi TaxID=2511006 RepID=A0A9Q0T556_9ROSI|nr:CYTOCHROME P450 98A9 [Salix koriyanagi]
METWVSYAFAWLATVSLILIASRLRRSKFNRPPGPKPWPIIGNLNLIGELPHRSLHALSQKYGPLMQVQFGSFPVVVGSSVEMAKTILKTHDVIFSGRPKTAAGKYTTYNYSDITWSPYGPYWRQARKMCLMELFSAKRLESYEYIRVEELQALLKTLHKSSGRPINLKDHLTDVSLNVISRMVLGKKYTAKSSDHHEKEIVTPEEFKEMIDELFLLNGVLDIGDSIPWVAFLDLQGYIKRMKVLSKKFDRFMEHVLDEHESRRTTEDKKWEPKDMVDVLLQLASDPNLEVKLERHGVKAFSQVIQATLSNLLHGFKWRLPDGERKEELDMEEIFGLSTPKKHPLVAIAEPRLPAHVYPK